MTNPVESSASRPVKKKPFSFKVFGIGGGGCNAVSHLARESLDGISFGAMNTDATALAQCAVPAKLLLGERLMRGLGTGGDADRGRDAAEAVIPKIRELCTGADIV